MSYSSEVLADSPLGYWRLGETSGTSIGDSSTHGRTAGTWTGSPTLGATGLLVGDSDKAVSLPGTAGTYGTLPYFSDLQGPNITWECVVNFPSIPSVWYLLIDRYRTSNRDQFMLAVVNDGGVAKAAAVVFPGPITVVGASTLTPGTTYHIAFTVSGTSVKLYVNGVLDGSGTLSGTMKTGTTHTPVIGAGYAGGSNPIYPLLGTLDEVAVYGTALSAARLLAHATAITPPTGADLALAGTAPAPSADFGLSVAGSTLALAGVAPDPVAVLALSAAVLSLDLAATLPPPVAAFSLSAPATGAALDLGGDVAAPVADFTLGLGYVVPETPPVETDSDVVEAGEVDQETHEADWHPDVPADLPATLPWAEDVARAFTVPTMDGTQPVYAVTEARTRRHVDRILVKAAGTWHDVTWFRGVRTPTPDYQLVEPLTYGPGRLTVPAVVPVFEDLGAIDWLAKGAKVVVQRIHPTTGDVVAVDYRGRISDWNVSGRELTVELGGLLTGPASHRWRPQPPVRRREDVAYWLYAGLRYLRQPVEWDEFGVALVTQGAAMYADYLLDLCSLGVKRNGEQVTVAYDEDARKWVVGAKDRETIHATVYFDDGPMKPDLRRDMTAEVDEVFVTAYLADGTKILNTVWPGLQQENPIPAYPMDDESTFGLDTTDADTDTGDGISVMKERLVLLGYLGRDDSYPLDTYDVSTQIAVYEARADLDLLAEPGMADAAEDMEADPDLWDVLWDLDATGWTTKEARILPLAQRRAVRRWNRSATGNKVDLNDAYDEQQAAVAVSTSLELGTVRSKNHARRLARRMLDDGSPNWVGTVSTRLALVRGEHTPGDPIDASDVMPARDLRPGMNLWAPLFDGGVRFHVSGADVSADGAEVRLMLDTRDRDTLQIAGIIERNRENRTSPSRAYLNARSSRTPKDIIFGHDEHFGILGHRVNTGAGQWTVYPLIAGDYGTVARVHVVTGPGAPPSYDEEMTGFEPDETEFAVFVFGEKVSAGWLAANVGNPLDDGNRWWASKAQRETAEERRLLYAVGSEKAPCGYWPGSKLSEETDEEGDPLPGDDLTGEWQDDAAFAYRAPDCVLWMAIYTAGQTRIKAGKQLYVQRDEGA